MNNEFDLNLVEFVRINRFHYTVDELAEERKVNVDVIKKIMKAYGFSPGDVEIQREGFDIKEFIKINHGFMTMTEIEKETGATVYTMRAVYKELGLTPLSVSEAFRIFAEKNKHLTLKQMAEIKQMHVPYVKKLMEDWGIKLADEKKVNDEQADQVVEQANQAVEQEQDEYFTTEDGVRMRKDRYDDVSALGYLPKRIKNNRPKW